MNLDITRLPQELLLLLLLAGACLLGVSFWEHSIRSDERAKVTKALDKAWRQRLQEAEGKALKELSEQGDRHAKEYHRLYERAEQLAGELRKRATRAEQAQRPHPITSIACPVCTGAQLAREDGEFLAGESAAAAATQLDLQRASKQYDTCRKTLEEVTKGIKK